MKKQILSTVLLSGLVLAIGATNASAESTVVDNVVTDPETTKVEVNLIEDDGNQPGKGPYLNNLAIVYTPKLYSFTGQTTLDTLTLDNTSSAKETQAVTVNDDRKTLTPWVLTAQMSKLVSGSTELNSVMKIDTSAGLKRYDIGKEVYDAATNTVDLERLPIDHANKVAISSNSFDFPNEVSLDAGGTAVPVITKTDNSAPTGGDLNGVTGYVGAAKLVMDQNEATTKGNYKGTITWTVAAQ